MHDTAVTTAGRHHLADSAALGVNIYDKKSLVTNEFWTNTSGKKNIVECSILFVFFSLGSERQANVKLLNFQKEK